MGDLDRPARLSVAGTLGLIAALATASGCGADDQSQATAATPVKGDDRGAASVPVNRKAKAKAEAQAVLDARSNGIITAAPTTLVLKLADFNIEPFLNAVPKGPVKITVLNRGTEEHELLVINSKGKLPVKGQRVDEAALERRHRVLGEISEVPAGRAASKTFTLKAGSYYLLCNVPGHYRAGMRATLIVRGR
jgi:uncharacterized cupredoxin-like copper-binding protein